MKLNIDEIAGLKVTLAGLGTRGGGTGVARFFAEHGARVTATDLREKEALQPALDELSDLQIDYVLGSHREKDFRREHTDLVIRNPAVPRFAPMLELARAEGIPVHMEMSLFLQLCPAPVIGITGTKGKTSTAFLCHHLLSYWDSASVLAGNMGVSALGQLQRIDDATPVVLEISNWQLEGLAEHRISPQIAVLTNISEDHLNTYRDFDEYASVKRSIARWMTPSDTFIVNGDCDLCFDLTDQPRSRIVQFSGSPGNAVTINDDSIGWKIGEQKGTVGLSGLRQFQSRYQRMNAAAALAAAVVRGAADSDIQAGMNTFPGVPDRNEFVAKINGVEFINDTAATAPAAVEAVLNGMNGKRLHVIVGGADKQVDLQPLAALLSARATSVVLLDGSATPTLASLLKQRNIQFSGPFQSMQAAVLAASNQARRGDIVILSPGCASFGLFRDEFDRGRQFREVVHAMERSTGKPVLP